MQPKTIFMLPVGAIGGAAIGAFIGSLWVNLKNGYNLEHSKEFVLVTGFPGLEQALTDPWRTGYLIMGLCVLAMVMMVVVLAVGQRLTQYGQAHFQSRAELRKNGLLAPMGAGLVFARMWRFGFVGRAFGLGRFISAVFDKFPHCLVVAPTRAGKGVGYVLPNVWLFPGSVLVLDVKGEIFEGTSRHRKANGDQIFYFSPFDFEHPTHRYNPLERVAQLRDPIEQYTELAKIADYFLLVSGEGSASDFLSEGRELFVAAGLLAFERGTPTIGEINRILFGAGATADVYTAHSEEVRHPNAAQTFRKFAGYSDRTLSSHASVLGGAGLTLWNNPAVDRATGGNDFSFDDMRKKPMSVYFVVNSDSIKTMAPLIRLFFGEAIATFRSSIPDPVREPYPVQMILDEFDQLGRMDIVVQALKQLAGHGIRASIITQSIPGLDKIYTEDDRLSIESACGMKLFLSPNEKKTAAEVSEALGKTTKVSKSDSYSPDSSGLVRRTISRRTEERPLLMPDDIRRLDRDKVILVPERQQPIMADRIIWYKDPILRPLMEKQTGPLPYPSREAENLRKVQEEMAALRATVGRLSETRVIEYRAPNEAARPADASDTYEWSAPASRPARENGVDTAAEVTDGEDAASEVSQPEHPVSGPAAKVIAEIEESKPILTDDELLASLLPSDHAAIGLMTAFTRKHASALS